MANRNLSDLQIKHCARTIAASLQTTEEIKSVASVGYKGTEGLPSNMTDEDRFVLLNAIQDEAKGLEAEL